MKELAVIGRRLSEPRTGFGRYLECLLRHWGRMETQFDRIRAYVWEDPGLPAQGKVEFEVVGLIGSPLIWENWTLANRLRQSSLIFGAYTLPWFLADRGVVSNLGIYESRPDDFPLLARMRTTLFYKRAARKAVRVIANSSSTRDDLVGYYGADPAKVEVVLLGADERLSPGPSELPGDLRARYGLPDGPFFLLVGKLSQRRNIPMLIEALAAVEGYSLVIVGPDYLGLDIEALARRSGVADRVYHVEHLPMEELVHCYRAATAFVLPTLHEGFSLTIVEAMACGTPAIVFDHASLEGLVRDAVLFAEAGVESLAAAMNLVASDRELHADLSRRSLEAAQAYRWETTAERTMLILERAAGFARTPDGSSPRQRAEFRRQLPEFVSVMGWIGRSASVYRLLVRQRNPQRIEDFCLAGVGNRQPCDAGLLIHSIFQ